MAKRRITIYIYTCERCGHEWQPRKKVKPTICPKCKSAYWDRPRRKK
jgi:predicted Zn-ribbon and HTH transcriptional regulator